MPVENERSFATRFLDEHPELRSAMARSQKLPELKKRLALPKDDATDENEEQLYIVKGDTVGSEDDLFVDALARGSNSATQDSVARELYLELDPSLKSLVLDQLKK